MSEELYDIEAAARALEPATDDELAEASEQVFQTLSGFSAKDCVTVCTAHLAMYSAEAGYDVYQMLRILLQAWNLLPDDDTTPNEYTDILDVVESGMRAAERKAKTP